jgi:hypothetical protein
MQVTPRYEFRAFGQEFGAVADTIRQLADREAVEESYEVYLVAVGAQDYSVKVRRGALDIKQRVDVQQSLERWRPLGKWPFPLRTMELEGTLPSIAACLRQARYERSEFLLATTGPGGAFRRANVFKCRFRFHVNRCATEIDDILINGAAIRSIAIESEDPALVAEFRSRVGLGDHENVSYPLALARTLGLAPLPDADRYG